MTKHSDKNDKTLVELTLLGEEEAYAELVTRHQHAVMGTAFKVTNNSHSAEDASQDAFVSAWVNLSALRDGSRFGSWVCSIAKNCARGLEAHYRNAVPDISLDLLENLDLEGEDSEWKLIREDYSDLHAAVEALGEKIRETIRLHYFEDRSVAEIAELLSVPVGTVKWRLSEGRKQLRKGYGIMEKTYNENESILARVMRQVEELKLWQLKGDRGGFEEDYKAVLSAIEGLEDSREKSHMLADTLLRGYWWLSGEKNDEMYERIKRAAEDGHNDDVMQVVASVEHGKLSGEERIEFIKNTQIPRFRGNNYPKTLAYLLFWLGYAYRQKGDYQGAIECFREVLETVPPIDVYYANAKAAIDGETRTVEAEKDSSVLRHDTHVIGEVYKKIGNRLYFWQQPGYGMCGYTKHASIFWHLSRCDALILDKDMRLGERKVSSDGAMSLTYCQNDAVCDTPAGHFENCSVYVCEGDVYGLTHCKTWFCENVGVVRQVLTRYGEDFEWVLSKYRINGGEGLLPFAEGNRWEYDPVTDEKAFLEEFENTFEVTACDGGTVAVASMAFLQVKGYHDTWEGKTLEACQNYCQRVSHDESKLCDVSGALARAESLAETKRQKTHTAIANDVMRRIFETDPDVAPNCTQMGRWNFFSYNKLLNDADGKVSFKEDRKYSFEWKGMQKCGIYGYKVLYSFMLTILQDAMGCIWSDEWVDGYEFDQRPDFSGSKEYTVKSFKVTDGETVETPVGTFGNCRHITFLYDSWGYFRGRQDYWFAPGVGIVKFEHPYWDDRLAIWYLTEYRGMGEGYFPSDDGLFRRYEPDVLGEGWHGSVEFTFDTDESGTVMFKNALGTQDVADYEAAIKE